MAPVSGRCALLLLLGCVALTACKRSEARAATRAIAGPLLEGRGLAELQIGVTTPEAVAAQFGEAAGVPRRNGGRVELLVRPLKLEFVTPTEPPGAQPRLYAVKTSLQKGGYRGKTGRGLGFLDPIETMLELYGEPQAEWIRMDDRLHYYIDGLVVTTQHPNLVRDFAELSKELEKAPPAITPQSRVVTGLTIVPPFEILEPAKPARAGQQVISSQPKTTLEVSAY